MRINEYPEPKSSFLAMEKDANIIVSRLMKNQRLKKLLYYNTPDALDRPELTKEQSISVIEKNITLIPKFILDGSVHNYIIIKFDDFIPNGNNPEFRDSIIQFFIINHFDNWHLKDFQLRPYKIVAEIDSMLDKTKLTGIGEINLLGANTFVLNEDFGGVILNYRVIHGGEDQKNMLNPVDEEKFLEDFAKMMEG